MNELLEISESSIRTVSMQFKRHLYEKINWTDRLIGIKGARGTGKTTMVLQWLRKLDIAPHRAVYLSLDELFFTTHTLLETARNLHLKGMEILVLDEVHKYPDWSREVKNLYDRYPKLKIVFTGSSILDIARHEADLSRRAMIYELSGLSYREYLSFLHGLHIPALTLEHLVSTDSKLREFLPPDFRPLEFFQDYLRHGYYPFYSESPDTYYERLRQLTRTIVESDMAELKGFDIRHAKKMLQLLYIIAQQVPFKPNINNLASKTQMHRNTIGNYLHFLHEARLIHLLYQSGSSVATLQKPKKVYLNNTNLLFALSEVAPSSGTVREVFFNNQMSASHVVTHSPQTDFEVDRRYHFEIGGKAKSRRQIKGLTQAWIARDDIEYPIGTEIPLWLFGFLY